MSVYTYEERKAVYQEAIDLYGVDAQLIVALEELSEAQKEICKVLRGGGDMGHLAEEVADATIMLEQVRLIFGINDAVCSKMDDKIQRLQKRMRERRADNLIANGVVISNSETATVTDTNVGSKITIRFKDFEIRPTLYLDGHKEPNKYDVVKWKKHEPREVYDIALGKKRMSDRNCFSIAHIYWNEKEPCWEFESVGIRFLEHYEEGLCEFVREWLELIGEPERE